MRKKIGVTAKLAMVTGWWVVVGAGCLSVPIPQAEADPARFYVLSTTTEPLPHPEQKLPAIYLLVEVADYLRSRPIIVRKSENEIQFREFARWGESLDVGIGRVLREELLARRVVSAVLPSTARTPGMGIGYEYVLSVRVLACEGAADGRVLFRAVWELAPIDPHAKPSRGEAGAANLRWDGKTEASLAAQLSVAVAGLAGEIAGAVRK